MSRREIDHSADPVSATTPPLKLVRYALTGALVGVALVGIFVPSGAHHIWIDLVAAIVGLIAVVGIAKFVKLY